MIGFCVTSTRNKPVHHNDYMRLYSMIEDTGKPLAFHAGYHWQDPSLATINRFLGMHALGFVWCNMVHMTNWILNGLPERFPKLKTVWVESGLAWVPFLMQRLDDQYLMRPSEAPQLKRLPSEYMNSNCFYTTQPMETTHPKALENTLEMIKAETQLHVLVRLAAFRFRPAAGDLRPAVPDRAGQAQHPGAERRADLQSRPDAGEEAGAAA